MSRAGFIRHYCEIILIRSTYRDNPTGYTEALEGYLTREGVTRRDMEAFVTAHRGDLPFWSDLWQQAEEELKRRLETTDDPE